jgi:hypothetical protein
MTIKKVFSFITVGFDSDQVLRLAGKPDEIFSSDNGICWSYCDENVKIFFNVGKEQLVNKIIIKKSGRGWKDGE